MILSAPLRVCIEIWYKINCLHGDGLPSPCGCVLRFHFMQYIQLLQVAVPLRVYIEKRRLAALCFRALTIRKMRTSFLGELKQSFCITICLSSPLSTAVRIPLEIYVHLRFALRNFWYCCKSYQHFLVP